MKPNYQEREREREPMHELVIFCDGPCRLFGVYVPGRGLRSIEVAMCGRICVRVWSVYNDVGDARPPITQSVASICVT